MWAAYWSPIFQALTTQCTNPCREVRHQAFLSLRNSLLSDGLALGSPDVWTAIFGEVLFPLTMKLLKPEVYSSDPVGMSETRVQAATLLCRIFLHYLVELYKWDGMLDLWIGILDIMDRLMNSGQGDSLVCKFPSSQLVHDSDGNKGRSRARKSQKYLTCYVEPRVPRFPKPGPISSKAVE